MTRSTKIKTAPREPMAVGIKTKAPASSVKRATPAASAALSSSSGTRTQGRPLPTQTGAADGRSACAAPVSGTLTGTVDCSTCTARAATVCRAVPAADLDRLSTAVRRYSHGAGETLVHDGDPARHVFLLSGGSVKVFRSLPDGRRAITGFLFRGDTLGFVGRDRFGFGADALEPVQLCRFPRPAFQALVRDTPSLEAELLNRASHELEAAQEQMLLLSRKTAVERVASFILWLIGRAVERGEPADPVQFPMIRADMADYLGLTTETVSRSITRLKTDRVIRLIQGNGAHVQDPERLTAIALGDG